MDTTTSLPAASPAAPDIHTTLTLAQLQRLALVPIPSRAKSPTAKEWQTKQFVPDDFDASGNVGLRLDGLADGDMDSAYAVVLAPYFMPDTKMIFGRASKPRSHFVYKPDKSMKYTKYLGLSKETLLECRTGGGHQTVIPPSVHPSGEQIAFEPGANLTPTAVSAKELAAAFAELAVASLIASIWKDGVRHDLALAVPAFMLKLGVPAETVIKIMGAVVEEFDNENSDRLRAIEDTVSKHENDSRVAGAQKLIELMPDTAQAFMKKVADWFGLKVNRDDAVRAAKTAAKHGAKPVIYVAADQYDVTTDEAYAHLVTANTLPVLFQRGGELQRVRVAPDVRGVERPFITPVGMAAMRERLMRVADWIGGTNPANAVPVQVPEFIASNILTMGEWPGIARLRDLTETPVITAEGKIIVEPGYQAGSQLWYFPAPGFVVPLVADVVDIEMALAAGDALLEVIVDFPFEDESSRTHALAYLLLPFMRELIDGPTPLHGISAPTPGTGKGLFTNAGAWIATGKDARMFTWKEDEAELSKTITSFLVSNSGGVLGVDNMEGTVESGVFAKLLTLTTWAERMLGTNAISGGDGVPNRAVWFVNGNNIGFSGEIGRRTLYIRMVADVENPETRTGFRHPKLREWIFAERGRLVHAALTLARYAFQLREVGQLPKLTTTPMGSFEAYDELMGGLMGAIGRGGWQGNRDRLRQRSNSDVEKLRDLVGAWARYAAAGQNMTAGELYDLAVRDRVLPDDLEGMDKGGAARELGKAIGKLEDQVVGEHRVVVRSHGGRKVYKLVPARAR